MVNCFPARGCSSARQSTSFATKGPRVQIPSPPPLPRWLPRSEWQLGRCVGGEYHLGCRFLLRVGSRVVWGVLVRCLGSLPNCQLWRSSYRNGRICCRRLFFCGLGRLLLLFRLCRPAPLPRSGTMLWPHERPRGYRSLRGVCAGCRRT